MDALILPYGQDFVSKEPVWQVVSELQSSIFFSCPTDSDSASTDYRYTAVYPQNVPTPFSNPQNIMDEVGSKYPRLVKIDLECSAKLNVWPSSSLQSISVKFALGDFQAVMSSDWIYGLEAKTSLTGAGTKTFQASQIFNTSVDKVVHGTWEGTSSTWKWVYDICGYPYSEHNSYVRGKDLVSVRINRMKISELR